MWDLGLQGKGPQVHHGTVEKDKERRTPQKFSSSMLCMSTKHLLGGRKIEGLFPSGTCLFGFLTGIKFNSLFTGSSTYYKMKNNRAWVMSI
jgi:hypothetical protein